MPTTRKFKERTVRIEFDYAMRVHMQDGDCLLAGPGNGCGCGLRRADGVTDAALVSRMFREHRVAILNAWKGPGEPWCATP